MENRETKIYSNEFTEEERAGLKRMILDYIVTAFNHVDWEETGKDFTDHHKPQEYMPDRDDAVEVFDVILDCFTDFDDDDGFEFLNNDEFYSALFNSVMDETIDHEVGLQGKTE